jgi:23S rRNA pseudouridine1911/1915/1917 synthase
MEDLKKINKGFNFMEINIIYEDNHIIVAEKPRGVLSQEDKTGDEDILTILKKYIKDKYNKPGNVFLGLVHRLDRSVGGVMVFARTSKAASRISEQIRNREFKKTYLAVVSGLIEDKANEMQDYLIKNPKNNTSSVVNERVSGAKKAILNYQVLESKENKTMVKINLQTGRHHQIRVQFSSRGYPLIGDIKYEGKNYKKSNERQGLALWSYEINFLHPTEKRQLTFRCEPPDQYPYNEFKIYN